MCRGYWKIEPRKELRMPVRRGKDADGPFYQWGDNGKKYRYTAGDEKARKQAKSKAGKQGQAAHAAGYKG